jgi:hypothetical protein
MKKKPVDDTQRRNPRSTSAQTVPESDPEGAFLVAAGHRAPAVHTMGSSVVRKSVQNALNWVKKYGGE